MFAKNQVDILYNYDVTDISIGWTIMTFCFFCIFDYYVINIEDIMTNKTMIWDATTLSMDKFA